MKYLIFLLLLFSTQALAKDLIMKDAVEACIKEHGSTIEMAMFEDCVRKTYPEVVIFYQNYCSSMMEEAHKTLQDMGAHKTSHVKKFKLNQEKNHGKRPKYDPE